MDNRYILFVALTRPAVNRFGIPQFGFSMIAAASALFGMWVGRGTGWHQPLYYLIFIPLFIVARALTEWDHNSFHILQIWFFTKGRGFGKPGGSMLTPIPVGIPRKARDIAGAV